MKAKLGAKNANKTAYKTNGNDKLLEELISKTTVILSIRKLSI
jgi:hypothetical protein